MDLRQLPAIDTASLFQIGGKARKKGKKPTYLPRIDEYLSEEGFADVGFSWDPLGIYIFVKVGKKFEECYFPDIAKGDGIEVFIDTRGIDSAAVVHKYCHHFVFLPKEKDGMVGAEVTRFRTEDRHEPSPHDKLEVHSEFFSKSYTIAIFIPEVCLFGYDPLEYPRVGFAYIVHRSGKDPQHFPLSSFSYKLESSPSLWSKFQLEGS